MKRQVLVTLIVPDDFKGIAPWTSEQSLDSLIHHWLEQGYGIHDYTVTFPCNIQYEGYTLLPSESAPCAS